MSCTVSNSAGLSRCRLKSPISADYVVLARLPGSVLYVDRARKNVDGTRSSRWGLSVSLA